MRTDYINKDDIIVTSGHTKTQANHYKLIIAITKQGGSIQSLSFSQIQKPDQIPSVRTKSGIDCPKPLPLPHKFYFKQSSMRLKQN